ncbi:MULTISPECIES: ligase-associated DNA damage response DEXH box helicase [Pseudomonas syringae group]|jgi:ATP-dependent Lhr-like helicase|uniref:ligase-associated DNA damage response DEXH box helicase n=1 Tax=Pseudomonas syringae group TaxID=136849 RepID=UPI000BB61492|nr:ligase-associated DNA damage response DEXH box helicase [Pseudomonas syringae]MCK9716623.1 ligase-associated DNA damage response DEXH box helicase [Pseudomonas syringae pv. syringae]MCK9760253.1 ligase-associated DNA damage response DEXH box helicase [Pseudomonas syringae pv. syringae]MDU8619984.1 ligase-associated DNA damage response DEXH box helicase [Pseudomonas syringae]PBP30683.1 DNA ligase-associated DEXH box helicase [Pseudomonas syringae]PBP45057.1 DNA ligase-associated DEXH box hel
MSRPTDFARRWFLARGWKPFAFQKEVWAAVKNGESGLLHASTGSGKTYAVWFAALNRFAKANTLTADNKPRKRKPPAEPLSVLWITPMRALAADTARALEAPLAELDIPWSVGLRTGDTSGSERARQSRRLPSALITTPESLTLLLTRADAQVALSTLKMVVVDEWHELIGNKRGVQLQLALARLRRWNPQLIVWGISATLGNQQHAQQVLIGDGGVTVQGKIVKDLQVDTLLPPSIERFPWAGHMGLRMLPQVVAEVESSASCLVFTNTRAQSEIWYQALLEARPDWAGLIALHHGSLAREVRDWVERALKEGALKAVVCTSSLDLGVDFLPVERVLQIGSPKGVARLMQRAGRSGHAPGRPSRVTLVPTHSLELVEAAAAHDAVEARMIEPRESPLQPLDVLVQHLVSIALGGGFLPDELLAEVRSAWAYRDLSDEQWQWALAFVRNGGHSLTAYPDYRRAEPDEDGVWRVPDARLARRHRMSVGTIVSEATVNLKYWKKGGGGGSLGSVEEGFIARLKPGDGFLFGGRLLELVRVENMTAYVKRATGKKAAVPRWNGGRMPLSSELADAVVEKFDAAARGEFNSPEMRAIKPLLEVQQQWSGLPRRDTLLAETLKSREGWHLFLYPFAGRHVHLGLGSLLAWRLSRHRPLTFSIAVNDYGLELLSASEIDWAQALQADLFSETDLLADIIASLNAGELALRRFREIARISGLVFSGYPGAAKSNRQLQASSGLFFEVFKQYDADNMLLTQAEQEVLRQELDLQRLELTLRQINSRTLDLHAIKRATPLAFPLLVERFRESLSSEKLADRIARMVRDLEKAAGPETEQ